VSVGVDSGEQRGVGVRLVKQSWWKIGSNGHMIWWMGPKCTKCQQQVRASQAMYGSRTLSALATLGDYAPAANFARSTLAAATSMPCGEAVLGAGSSPGGWDPTDI
jgi:hypothetical protein